MRPLRLNYAVMRFQQTLCQLQMFYLRRARQLKHAPKVFNRLETWSLEDLPTLLKTEKVLDDYMHLQGMRFVQRLLEAQLQQWNIYLNYAANEPRLLSNIKDRVIRASSSLQKVIATILKLEVELFEDGEGKAVERMAADQAHLTEEELEQAKANAAHNANDEPAPFSPKAARQPPPRTKSEKKQGKQVAQPKSTETQPVPEPVLEDKSEDFKAQAHAHTRKHLGKLKVTHAQMQSTSKRVGELAARRSGNRAAGGGRAIKPACLQGLGNASVLTVRDAEFEFFEDLKEEILKADCHRVP